MSATTIDVYVASPPVVDVTVVSDPVFEVLGVLPTGPRGPAGATGATGAAGATGATGAAGADGADGQGVPVGGTTGQVLAKATATDFDTAWTDPAAGGGAVDSVNGQTGVVVLGAADVGADAAGAAAAAQAASQPVDSDLTAIAALSTTAYGRALLALADAAAGRTALGLGTASTAATGDFDAAGAAAAAQAASQPVDSDLTAIAALTTTAYGRAFLALADAAAARTALGLGTAATAATGDFDAAGVAAALVDDLSGVTNAATARTNLGLGTAATKDTGTADGQVPLNSDLLDLVGGDGVDVTAGATLSVDVDATVLRTTGAQSVSGAKTFADATVLLSGATSGTSTLKAAAVAGTTTLTLPGSTDTLVGLAATQTLTNKTLTAPTITAGVLGVAATLTSAGSVFLLASAAMTINFVSGVNPSAMTVAQTVKYLQAGNSVAANRFVLAASIIGNDPTAAVGPGGSRIFEDANTITADTQTGLNAGGYSSFRAGPTWGVANSGTWTSGTYTAYAAAPSVGSGTTLSTATLYSSAPVVAGTVTTLNIFKANNPTGGGTITTLYGLDIAALTAGTTNVGIRNASTSVKTPTANANITAVTATISHTAAIITLTANASYTLTSAPTITDGVDGEDLLIINVDTADTITIQDQATLASSNLRLSAPTIALGPRDSIRLVYSSTVGDWVQVGQVGRVATDVIFDAKGDLPVGTGADTAAKLTVGANDTLLTADSTQSTGLKYITRATLAADAAFTGAYAPVFSGARAYRTTTQSLNTATWTAIGLDAEDFDTATYHDNATNNSRMTVPTTGKYVAFGGIAFASNATGTRYIGIWKNSIATGSVLANTNRAASSESALNNNLDISTGPVALTAGDYVELAGYQNSGGALNVISGTDTTWLSLMRVA